MIDPLSSGTDRQRTTDPKIYRHCLQGLRAIIDKGPFIKWLESQQPNRMLGGGCDDCALAQWSGHNVGYITYGNSGYLPTWAIAFVHDFCRNGPLTVGRALQIMRAQS